MSNQTEALVLQKLSGLAKIGWAIVLLAFGFGGWCATLELRLRNVEGKVDAHEIWATAREEALSQANTKEQKMIQRIGDRLGVTFEGIE